MNAVGIVSEYNPFHLGHLYHLKKVRELCSCDVVLICALSGDFVQRGEPAVISKFARAEAAVRSGADLAVELPTVWSMQSAEAYADAAVGILASMGVESLSFGTETDNYNALEDIASILADDGFEAELSAAVKEKNSLSFPALREEVLRRFAGDKASLINTPNNILAVEYMKTVIKKSYDIRFLPVQRTGAGHDAFSSGTVRSASEIRDRLLKGEDISGFVPEESYRIIREEIRKGRAPVSADSIEQALVSRLRGLTVDDFAGVKDCDKELASRLTDAVYGNYTLKDIYFTAKTKKYTLSRIRRASMCAALGITKEMQNSDIPYIRILAAGKKGQAYLRELKKNRPDLPLATKAADILRMGEKCREAVIKDSAIHDIYVLGYSEPNEKVCGADFRRSPIML